MSFLPYEPQIHSLSLTIGPPSSAPYSRMLSIWLPCFTVGWARPFGSNRNVGLRLLEGLAFHEPALPRSPFEMLEFDCQLLSAELTRALPRQSLVPRLVTMLSTTPPVAMVASEPPVVTCKIGR